MSKFEIDFRSGLWTLSNGQLLLEASGIIRDRGTIRCTLSVIRGGTLIFRDNVNLTGDRSRRRVVKRVLDVLPDTEIGEDALLALDEAIRRNPQEAHGGGKDHHNNVHDTPTDYSGTVTTLDQLKEKVAAWLIVEDWDVLTAILGAVIAHRLGGESPWLLIVAPSSGSKTELLRMTWQVQGIYPLSELTARTLASGLDTHGNIEPSLLARLKDEILVLKDLTTVLEMRQEERQAVLAQLREVYDGRFDKAWGTGKELHWEGRLGCVAGVTPVIDQHHQVMGLLGPRFLLMRMVAGNRQDIATRAMKNAQQEGRMRSELAGAAAAFLKNIDLKPPTVRPSIINALAQLADLVTRARSPVIRDGYRRELEYAPEPESPGRLARQLHALVQGITLALGQVEAGDEALHIVKRIGMDCVPAIREKALRTLYEKCKDAEYYAAEAEESEYIYDTPSDFSETIGDGDNAAGDISWMVRTGQMARSAQYATSTVRRALEDLQALGLVFRRQSSTGRKEDHWALTRTGMAAMRTVSEKSDGCHTNNNPDRPQASSTTGSDDVSGTSDDSDGISRYFSQHSTPEPAPPFKCSIRPGGWCANCEIPCPGAVPFVMATADDHGAEADGSEDD